MSIILVIKQQDGEVLRWSSLSGLLRLGGWPILPEVSKGGDFGPGIVGLFSLNIPFYRPVRYDSRGIGRLILLPHTESSQKRILVVAEARARRQLLQLLAVSSA